MNNFEKIKQMTVEEMAKHLTNKANCGRCAFVDLDLACHCECFDGTKQWLLQEVEE